MTKTANRMSWRTRDTVAGRPWKGATREYDLFKELTVGVVIVTLLVIAAAAIFSSPDDKSVTLKSWSQSRPLDFVTTATAELAGTSGTAQYGPPYNGTKDATQTIGPLDLQTASGVRIPIDTAQVFVVGPLSTLPAPPTSIAEWKAASSSTQAKWTAAYSTALGKAKGEIVPAATTAEGPVPAIMGSLLTMARQGSLDAALESGVSFYNFDYTKSVLFMGDGNYLNDLAASLHMSGDQWGMMNETGNYPGQSWLWLFSFFYQIEPFSSAANADLLVVGVVGVLTLLLLLVPFIPGLRDIPRLIPVHRLIWRDYYKRR